MQSSPVNKHQPSTFHDFVVIGALTITVAAGTNSVFESIRLDQRGSSSSQLDPVIRKLSTDDSNLNSNLNPDFSRVCTHCLALGHSARSCVNRWHCKFCFNYGHRARTYLAKSKPKFVWAPKQPGPLDQDSATQHAPKVPP